MARLLVLLVLAASSSQALHAEVPERFHGTWALDLEATITAADALDPPMPPDRREQMNREMPQVVASSNMRISQTTLTLLENGADRGSFTLTPQEELDGRAVFGAGKMGTITLQLNEEGLLNLSATSDDDMDIMWWKQLGSEGSEAQLPNSGVAFLDNLRSCSAGVFHISYPGFGSSKNTIIGWQGNHCQVRIEHRQVALTCNYSEATIALLTTEAKYENARKGVLSGSTDSEESQRVAAECSPE